MRPYAEHHLKGDHSLAHTLDLKVIAEGVETADPRAFLRTLGCDEMQGFLCSRPLPAEEISVIMKERGSC